MASDSGGLGVGFFIVKLLEKWSRQPSLLNEEVAALRGLADQAQGSRRTEVPHAKPP